MIRFLEYHNLLYLQEGRIIINLSKLPTTAFPYMPISIYTQAPNYIIRLHLIDPYQYGHVLISSEE